MNKNKFKLISNDNFPPKINLQFSVTEKETKDNNEILELKKNKNKISNYNNWDIGKKYSNDYELIYIPNKKYKNNSISNYEPLSRSYFKLLEMIVDFDLINLRKKLKIACIAEGPGGFMESIINYRKRIGKYNDELYGITLKSINNDIPGWKKAHYFIKKNKINISYGEDNTGNLYKLSNIINFSKNFDNDADFITADGGFDFSYNFNKQEILSYRILYCEIICALSIQKKGGTFVIKFFDIYHQITYSLLYLLYTHYNYIYITKPNTSRPANSEKYIICKGFKGVDQVYLKKLYIILDNWSYIEKNNMFITNLFDFNDNIFYNQIKNINSIFFNIQNNNIKKTLEIIENINCKEIKNINTDLINQIIIAYKWCKTYKVSINFNSIYLLKYKHLLKL